MRKLAVALLLLLVAAAAWTRIAWTDDNEVRINDRCDATTFPPEAGCVGHGGVTFQQLLATINPQDFGHPKWNFKFGGHLEAGRPFRVVNEGGEPHSFVEVSEYGTGIVPPLNGVFPPGHGPAVPVESFPSLEAANGANIVLPNGSRTVPGLAAGHHKFQCLIHPWMQIEIDVREKDRDGH
jgi:hypothetical protein